MLATGERRTALYKMCVMPVLAERQREFSERILALRAKELEPVEEFIFGDPKVEESKRMTISELRAKMIDDRVFSYDLRSPRFGIMRASRKMVAAYYGLDADALISFIRTQKNVIARQLCFYLIYMHEDKSTPDIGRIFNGRDHTTILHGIKKSAMRFYSCEHEFRVAYDYCRGNLYERDEYYWAA
jgi:hypothetical protein